jgi:hypothetical protein
VNGFVPNDNRLHYIFPFLITLFFYRSHGKQYTLPILSERLISWLENLLNGDSPYIYRGTLQSGWGLLSNNVLHDRSGFEDDDDPAKKRLLYRARYFDRIR